MNLCKFFLNFYKIIGTCSSENSCFANTCMISIRAILLLFSVLSVSLSNIPIKLLPHNSSLAFTVFWCSFWSHLFDRAFAKTFAKSKSISSLRLAFCSLQLPVTGISNECNAFDDGGFKIVAARLLLQEGDGNANDRDGSGLITHSTFAVVELLEYL